MASVWIKDRKTWKLIEATLREDLSADEITRIEEEWTRYRLAAEREARFLGKPRPENADWDWSSKLREVREFPVVCTGVFYKEKCQGLMMLNLTPKTNRLPPPNTCMVLYLEYLEAAPWNQKGYVADNSKYSGVGSALLWAAVYQSLLHGCAGSLGLHSLKEALGFYMEKGFADIESDPLEDDLHYLELSPSKAAILIEEAQP